MSKVMLVNVVNEEESRIAIVADGLLEEVAVETAQVERLEGNIYKARIVKVVPSLDAVFVDFGAEKNGFLPVDDIHQGYFPEGKRATSALKVGQELMVQVRKGETGQKGAALTTYVSLPGRYFVLMPYVAKRGVSRKIEDEATRKQLREALDAAQVPEEMGYIVRTAAEGRTKQELTRDAQYLLRLWKRILRDYEEAPAPSLLYQESDIVIRTIRDYFTPAVEEVWIDDAEVYEQVRRFFQAVMPWYTRRVKLHQRRTPIFARYNVEQQLATIYEKTVPLPSGGSIVIEQTEALVSIDVNSGGAFKGKDIEETALKVNEEAAREAARQLRLRDLGGLIVVDFIDMRSAANRAAVKRTLQKALKEDKARTQVGSISQFGLLELSRQRLKPGAAAAVTRPCPTCRGSGRVRTTESFALAILRMIQAELPRKELRQVRVGVPPDVAALLLNRKRRQISEWEREFEKSIQIFAEPLLGPNDYCFVFVENGKPRTETNAPGVAQELLAVQRGIPEPPVRAQRAPAYILMEDEPETESPPEEPPAEAKAEGAAAAEEPPKKKRRRRRRKKKAGEGQAAQEAVQTAPEGSGTGGEIPTVPAAAEAGPAEPAAPAAETAQSEATAAAGESEPGEAQKPKRKRRRRSRKKKPEAREETEAPQAAPEDGAAGEAPAEPLAATSEESGPAASDEGGSGRTPTAKASPEESPAPTPPVDSSQPPAKAPHRPEGEPAGEGKPERKRTRGKKKSEEAPGVAQAPEAPAETGPAPATTPETPSDTEEKPRRRRPRKKKTEEAGGEIHPPEAAAGPGPSEAQPAPEEKPKRRRARTKKSEEAGAEIPGAETTAETDPAPAEAEAKPDTQGKPKPRRSRRKRAEEPAEGS